MTEKDVIEILEDDELKKQYQKIVDQVKKILTIQNEETENEDYLNNDNIYK